MISDQLRCYGSRRRCAGYHSATKKPPHHRPLLIRHNQLLLTDPRALRKTWNVRVYFSFSPWQVSSVVINIPRWMYCLGLLLLLKTILLSHATCDWIRIGRGFTVVGRSLPLATKRTLQTYPPHRRGDQLRNSQFYRRHYGTSWRHDLPVRRKWRGSICGLCRLYVSRIVDCSIIEIDVFSWL